MSKQKKSQPAVAFSSTRNFKVTHQSLTISDINFKTRTITGNTELSVLPLTPTGKLWRLHLNCKQCRILRVSVNGKQNANYSYVDPTLSICPPDTKKRNLEYYDMCHNEKVRLCDSDCTANSGELTVKIPKDTYSTPGMENKPLKVVIEFSLEKPQGGVQFVLPPDGATGEAMQHAHVFTYGWENSSRLWFPCVDSYTEPCPWSLCFTVPTNMIAVSCGDLTEQLISTDGRKKTYFYSLSIPTAAPCIAFAVGCFEVYPDPVMQEVTHFCLPGLLPILKNTVQFVSEVFGFYEELLSTRFPHSSYKLVFVDQAYKEAASYSTLGIFSTNLLHSARVIDQVMVTRRLIASAIAEQYFGCYILPQQWSDWWLIRGISKFVGGLFCRKAFGNTDYLYWVREELQKVCLYEAEHTLPPLCSSISPSPSAASSGSTPAPPPPSSSGSARGSFHPNLLSETEIDILHSRAGLVIRMIQLKIGQDLLLQVFNKLLTLASAASQTAEWSLWQNLIISTGGFMKLILTVSGKDLSTFMEQWVCRSGIARFHASFNFIRKKNMIELKLKQDVPRGSPKLVGPMSVVVQEFDGRFSHNIQVEDSVSVHELPCHSKIRKAKKRKVPLTHGEEVEIDISSMDMEVPVLWVRVDPEYQWIRQLTLEQSDTIWHCLLKYERDANAQLDAVEALESFQTNQTRDVFRDAILNSNFFYRVREQAAKSLAKLITDTASSGGIPSFIISIIQRLYGSSANQTIVRFNDFTNIAAYFLQKALPVHVAGIRNVHKQCPKEVIHFLMELFKYNDNQMNKYSDCYLVSGLIDALAESITPKVAVALPAGVDFIKTPTAALSKEAQMVLQEIVQHLNIEKVLPSYRYSVTTSCLNCLRVLQRNGHLPSDSSLFRDYAMPNNFIDVRLAAIKAISDVVQAEHTEDDLKFLLNLIQNDPEPRIRLTVLTSLASSPPFTRRVESKLDTLELVEQLWDVLCTKFYYDARLRNAAVQVYASLYGRLTPKCVPGLGIVIDLKEKVARSSISTPTPSLRSLGDEMRTVSPTPLQAASPGLSIKLTPAADDSTGYTLLGKPSSHHHHESSSSSSQAASAGPPSLSLKIPTAALKRISPSLSRGEREGSMTGTASPESVLSASYLSDDSATPSPYTGGGGGHKHKRHKGEPKQKHKKKKSKKKHKHKHSSREQVVDVETLDS